MYVPTFAKGMFEYWERTIKDNNLSYNELIIPLYINNGGQNRRTADSIIIEFLKNTSYESRLKKSVTNKGEVYYGNRGCIFDKDMNPLIVTCLKCEKVDPPTNRTYFKYTEAILKVNPKVFLDQTTLINKAIIKKIIPILATEDIYVDRRTGIEGFSGKVRIEICDTNDMFFTPNVPSPNDCNNYLLNQILRDNISEVVDNFDSL